MAINHSPESVYYHNSLVKRQWSFTSETIPNIYICRKTYLDFSGLFWKRETHFIAELYKTGLHICSNF